MARFIKKNKINYYFFTMPSDKLNMCRDRSLLENNIIVYFWFYILKQEEKKKQNCKSVQWLQLLT